MDYSIVPIDIRSSEYRPAVYGLLSETFGYEIPSGRLEDVTVTNSETPSLYLAAVENNEMIGFNAFISHDLVLGGKVLHGFQSCWTATSAAHRGKKIFQNVMNRAKELLHDQGAAFIFGFPNDNSQPIFTKKLGFREVASLKWRTPNLPLMRGRNFTAKLSSVEGHIVQNDRQLIDLKRKRPDGPPHVCELNGDLIWAVTRVKEKASLKIKYLDIGGMEISEPGNLGALLEGLAQKAPGTRYFQLTTTEGNSYNSLLRGVKPAQTNDLIVFDLNFDSTNVPFNFFGGVRDVF